MGLFDFFRSKPQKPAPKPLKFFHSEHFFRAELSKRPEVQSVYTFLNIYVTAKERAADVVLIAYAYNAENTPLFGLSETLLQRVEWPFHPQMAEAIDRTVNKLNNYFTLKNEPAV